MKIVIDITDSDKEIIDNGFKSSEVSVNFYKRLIMAIQQGTPLPKGHGRLIDANEFELYIRDGFRDLKGMFKTEEYLHMAEHLTESFLTDIQEQETVVPEDKDVENEVSD